MMGFNWDSRAVAAAPIPLDKLPLIENAVTNQCDASDGLLDGLVQDPRACSFEPAVLRCQGAETKDCLIGAQIEAVREVYGGPANSSGRRITPGFRQARRATADGMFDAFSALVDWVEQGKAPSASSPRGARWWPHAPALSARTRSKPSTRARATSTTQRTSSARRRSRPTTTEVQGVVAVRTE